MPLQLDHLDDVTRPFMLAELARDEARRDGVYVSGRLSPAGASRYPGLLRDALTHGGPTSFEDELARPGILSDTEPFLRKGRPVRMNARASQTIAEGEFNRYYIRGLCLRVLDDGGGEVQVYRARQSSRPRPESERMIGMLLDPALLLDDLRLHVGREPTVLPYVNSGLSVRIA